MAASTSPSRKSLATNGSQLHSDLNWQAGNGNDVDHAQGGECLSLGAVDLAVGVGVEFWSQQMVARGRQVKRNDEQWLRPNCAAR